jgi:hypothetical protein
MRDTRQSGAHHPPSGTYSENKYKVNWEARYAAIMR